MRLYTLKFAEDGHGLAKRVEFKAEDALGALIIAHREAARRTAELWDGTKRLCTICAARTEAESPRARLT